MQRYEIVNMTFFSVAFLAWPFSPYFDECKKLKKIFMYSEIPLNVTLLKLNTFHVLEKCLLFL